ncbi:MAG: class I mannose-6-phosphate isomerase [Verrucomicrobiota bacterium]|nr:class I mannose-6-phosphate isomerase [Verrucomicrobiota bacterium]
MSRPLLDQPLLFAPIFQERIWGGRRLEELYGKALPAGRKIGESWEIVDRAEAQSVVLAGPLAGVTLHELWRDHRREIFGDLPDTDRFPLLIKLLDAAEKLSLQVHPPDEVAAELNAEAKSEFWYIAEAAPGADLYLGLKKQSSRAMFEAAIAKGEVEAHVHRVNVRAGDAMFLPSGRMHAIGAGNVIVEIQQNSDSTYRVFDWNRTGKNGPPRKLHVEESLRSIDFEDFEPALLEARGEQLVRQSFFEIDRWELDGARTVCAPGRFAIVICLSGEVACAEVSIAPGHCLLVPATLAERHLQPRAKKTSLLRVMLPA